MKNFMDVDYSSQKGNVIKFNISYFDFGVATMYNRNLIEIPTDQRDKEDRSTYKYCSDNLNVNKKALDMGVPQVFLKDNIVINFVNGKFRFLDGLGRSCMSEDSKVWAKLVSEYEYVLKNIYMGVIIYVDLEQEVERFMLEKLLNGGRHYNSRDKRNNQYSPYYSYSYIKMAVKQELDAQEGPLYNIAKVFFEQKKLNSCYLNAIVDLVSQVAFRAIKGNHAAEEVSIHYHPSNPLVNAGTALYSWGDINFEAFSKWMKHMCNISKLILENALWTVSIGGVECPQENAYKMTRGQVSKYKLNKALLGNFIAALDEVFGQNEQMEEEFIKKISRSGIALNILKEIINKHDKMGDKEKVKSFSDTSSTQTANKNLNWFDCYLSFVKNVRMEAIQ